MLVKMTSIIQDSLGQICLSFASSKQDSGMSNSSGDFETKLHLLLFTKILC